MGRGRKPITEIVQETTGRNLWDILQEDCDNCHSVTDAIQILAKMDVNISAGGLYNNIKKAIADGTLPEDAVCKDWPINPSKGGKRGRGKMSLNSIAQKKLGRSLWNILDKECKSCSNIFEAVEVLKGLGLKISTSGLYGLVQRTIKKGDLTGEEHYASWNLSKTGHKRSKKGKIPSAEDKITVSYQGKNILMTVICSKCGSQWKEHFIDYGDHNFGLLAHRCRNCQKWGTFILIGSILEKDVRIGVVQDDDGLNREKYLDKNNVPIANPFPVEKCVNFCSQELDKKLRQRKPY